MHYMYAVPSVVCVYVCYAMACTIGGQAIEVFSSPDALNDKTCGGTNLTMLAVTTSTDSIDPMAATKSGDNGSEGVGGVGTSQLWYSMIAPFQQMRFTGAVWYQVQ